MESLPHVLSELLSSKGVSQKEFALRVGVSPASINQVVNGRNVPRPDRATSWCEALNLSRTESTRLIDAIHLANASDHVRAIVGRLEREVARLRKHLA